MIQILQNERDGKESPIINVESWREALQVLTTKWGDGIALPGAFEPVSKNSRVFWREIQDGKGNSVAVVLDDRRNSQEWN